MKGPVTYHINCDCASYFWTRKPVGEGRFMRCRGCGRRLGDFDYTVAKPKLATIEKAKTSDDRHYIRWGDVPVGERSRRYDRRSKGFHQGTSAYRVTWDVTLQKWRVDDSMLPYLGRECLASFHLGMTVRPVYLLRGQLVGIGPDGEPLLRKVVSVGLLEASDIFVPHLDDKNEAARYREFLDARSLR